MMAGEREIKDRGMRKRLRGLGDRIKFAQRIREN